ncbi:MAG TPA: PD-(D/E)XK nuclease family protein [Dermatophilaceae bacterium]
MTSETGEAVPVAPVQQSFDGMPRRLYSASPSKLLAWLDCPLRYRMQYLDRPRPAARPQRAHTSIGVATHNALRDFWGLTPVERTPMAVERLVRQSWIDVGFRDADQSAEWRVRTTERVTAYLRGIDRDRQPLGVERTVSMRTKTLAVTGRIDRLDDRDGELVVVDYKTGRTRLRDDDARTSLPLALYAVAAAGMFRRPCVRVELHHLPTGEVLSHEHTPESLQRKVAEAESIASDLRRADGAYAEEGDGSPLFDPHVSPICPWCDFRAHCPAGQLVGPEKSDWAGLEADAAAGNGTADGEVGTRPV